MQHNYTTIRVHSAFKSCTPRAVQCVPIRNANAVRNELGRYSCMYRSTQRQQPILHALVICQLSYCAAKQGHPAQALCTGCSCRFPSRTSRSTIDSRKRLLSKPRGHCQHDSTPGCPACRFESLCVSHHSLYASP